MRARAAARGPLPTGQWAVPRRRQLCRPPLPGSVGWGLWTQSTWSSGKRKENSNLKKVKILISLSFSLIKVFFNNKLKAKQPMLSGAQEAAAPAAGPAAEGRVGSELDLSRKNQKGAQRSAITNFLIPAFFKLLSNPCHPSLYLNLKSTV